MQAKQYNQIADAIRALDNSDEKAALLQVVICNFIASDPLFDSQQFLRRSFIDTEHNRRQLRPCV